MYIYAYMSASILIEHRLCFIDPSLDKFRLFAYAHSLYHAVRHDPHCFSSDGRPIAFRFMQQRASDLKHALRALIQ